MTAVGACFIPKGYIPCSDRCNATITLVGACFIPKVYITMLWPLSWDDDNCRSMFLIWMTYYKVLSVVMQRLQLSEHVSYLRDILSCSDCCCATMTAVGACFIPKGYITMLWPLSCDDYNCQSIFHTKGIYYHALTIVMRRWQLSEHVS